MIKFGKKKDAPAGADDATKIAVAHGAEVEGEAPAKKKIPLLFIIAPVALLVLGGGGAGAFFMLQPKPAAAEGEHGEAAEKGHGAEKGGHGEEKKGGGGHGGDSKGGEADPSMGKIAPGPDGVTFFTLPDMVVNIQSSDGRPTVMKLSLTLEMRDEGLAYSLQSQMPRMQDMFQSFLRELRPEDLAGSAGNFQLRAEILRRVNLIAAPAKVDAVLIEEMLIQ